MKKQQKYRRFFCKKGQASFYVHCRSVWAVVVVCCIAQLEVELKALDFINNIFARLLDSLRSLPICQLPTAKKKYKT